MYKDLSEEEREDIKESMRLMRNPKYHKKDCDEFWIGLAKASHQHRWQRDNQGKSTDSSVDEESPTRGTSHAHQTESGTTNTKERTNTKEHSEHSARITPTTRVVS